jgi:hypothetical protein
MMKLFVTFAAVAGIVSGMADPASALTATLAKKCRAMMVQAYPPVTAGSPVGDAQQEREFFHACVAQNGRMKDFETTGRGK